ncbi:MAG: hypothetical protein HY619_00885 [Thaumarchaeota archaeon]|nr:hypothetical protein [Nitrososphaerota archaeon]
MSMEATQAISKREAAGLTEPQRQMLKVIRERRSVGLDEIESHPKEIRYLITKGWLRLAVTQHAWGIDFRLEPGQKLITEQV